MLENGDSYCVSLWEKIKTLSIEEFDKIYDLLNVKFDKDRIGSLNNVEDRDSVILVSNENEKPFSNLERIVNGYDKYIKIRPNDVVFYLDPVSTNNEKIAVKLSDEVAKLGAKTISLSSKKHLLNHASVEDLMLTKILFPS